MVMSAEQHLWACALEVERQHGEAAQLYASMRADELEADGAYEGARTWRAILRRIEALEQPDGSLA
jgi:hypothetical protein